MNYVYAKFEGMIAHMKDVQLAKRTVSDRLLYLSVTFSSRMNKAISLAFLLSLCIAVGVSLANIVLYAHTREENGSEKRWRTSEFHLIRPLSIRKKPTMSETESDRRQWRTRRADRSS
jgi:hypothetical protein